MPSVGSRGSMWGRRVVRTIRDVLVLTVPALLIFLIVLEVVFRTLIPACELPYFSNDNPWHVARYDVGLRKTGTATFGPLGSQRGRWSLNAEGWNSDVEFLPEPERSRPLVAVIGDSFVEGFHVDVGERFVDRLRDRLSGRADVYAFGMSGAPLSQYLHVSRYVRERFAPDALVFVVIHNDFAESLADRSPREYFLQLDASAGGIREIPPTLYQPSGVRRALSRSAVARYLISNVRLRHALSRLVGRDSGETARPRRGTPEAMAGDPDVSLAAAYVLRAIREENPRTPVLFVMDAQRSAIYETGQPAVHALNAAMRDAVESAGMEFLDLTSAFARHYRDHGRRFESRWDGHWDDLGHRVVAETLAGPIDGMLAREPAGPPASETGARAARPGADPLR